jgi:hypothetical protein
VCLSRSTIFGDFLEDPDVGSVEDFLRGALGTRGYAETMRVGSREVVNGECRLGI